MNSSAEEDWMAWGSRVMKESYDAGFRLGLTAGFVAGSIVTAGVMLFWVARLLNNIKALQDG